MHYKFVFTAEKDIKDAIRSLRAQFRRELTKVNKSKLSGKGTDDIYRPKWQYFEHLEFLQPITTSMKRTISSYSVSV